MFERFTERARRVVVLAQEEARLMHHDYIGTEHLLLGLIHESDGIAGRALAAAGVTLEVARARVGDIVSPGSKPVSGHVPFTRGAKDALEHSLRESLQLGHNYIGTEHLLLALAGQKKGPHLEVFRKLNLPTDAIKQQVINLSSSSPEDALLPQATDSPETGSLIDRGSFGAWLDETLGEARHLFPPATIEALLATEKEADLAASAYLGTEHLLLAILRPADEIPARVAAKLGIALDSIVAESARLAGRQTHAPGQLLVSSGLEHVLAFSVFEALRRGANAVQLADLFLAISQEPSGIGNIVLRKMGGPPERLQHETKRLIAGSGD